MSIPTTASGWPYLTGSSFVHDTPAYTLDLAQKLETGKSAVADAINAATRAETAATALESVGQWQPFTPTWKTGITTLTIGDGILQGYYTQIGKVVHYEIFLQRGSSTHLGTGVYTWDRPPVSPAAWNRHLGLGFVSRGNLPATAAPVSSTAMGLYLPDGTRVSNTTPGSWASGDTITITGTYRAQ